MALKKVRLFDIIGEDGRLIETVEKVHKGLGALHKGEASAFVVYEVLQNDTGGTSGHKHVINMYTKEELNEDIERGIIRFDI